MLSISDLTVRIAGRLLIDRASVNLPTGVKAGFVGRNGAGKSTLFKIITGAMASETGNVSLPRNTRLGQVAQEAPGTEDPLIDIVLAADTERASLMLEANTATDPNRIAEIQTRLVDIGAHAAESRAATILSGLGFDKQAQMRPASSFSGGWRMRVALAAVLFSEPDLLLLDEPTNYLDLEGTLWLEDYVRRYPYTVIIISHDRDLLNSAVNSIVHLEGKKLTFYRGGFDQFQKQKAESDILQGKMRVKQLANKKHMEDFVARFRAKASKAKQAQSRLKALEKLDVVDAVIDESIMSMKFTSPERPVASPIITIEDGSVGYTPGAPILRDLTLRIDNDDRIALLGSNGNGKSTFAKMLCDRLQLEGGRQVTANGLRVGFFAQHQLDDLIPDQSPVEHIHRLMPKEGTARVRAKVAQIGLSTEKMNTKVRDLSGGEKARLLLGIATFDNPHLLILDEPTNHLDIDSRTALIRALNGYNGAVILISHDRHLIEATADRLWLVENGTVAPFTDDIEAYRQLILNAGKKKSTKQVAENTKPKLSKTEQRKAAAARREELAPLRKKIKEIESLVAKLESQIQQLEAELGDAEIYEKSPDLAQKKIMKRGELERDLEKTEETWTQLSTQYEEEKKIF